MRLACPMTEKKKASAALALALLISSTSVLMLSSLGGANPVEQKSSEAFTINADGSISPSTAPIQQTGNIYSLTRDINGSIKVVSNSVVLDGNGHTINVPFGEFTAGIQLDDVHNVTVKNLVILGGAFGVNLGGMFNTILNNTIMEQDNGVYSLETAPAGVFVNNASSNVIAGNIFADNKVCVSLISWNPGACTKNLLFKNTFKNSTNALLLYDSSNNTFYHNNFIDNENIVNDGGYSGYHIVSVNVWDDEDHLGNYWGDYFSRYPNASEIGNSGIGDTPYVVRPAGFVDPSNLSMSESLDFWSALNAIYATNIDHYPLFYPFDIERGSIAFPTASPDPQTTEPFPTTLVIAVSGVSAAIIAVGFAVYLVKFRKRGEVPAQQH